MEKKKDGGVNFLMTYVVFGEVNPNDGASWMRTGILTAVVINDILC